MIVEDLIAELEKQPKDAWVDAMFPNGSDAFAVNAVDNFELADGRTVVVLDIADNTPLRAV